MDKEKQPPMEGKGEEKETRERILAAARRLMAQKGFKGATTRKISELAGVNEVTIFRHFKNKERILLELLEELTSIRPLLAESIQGEFPSLKELLVHYARTYYQSLVERKEIMMICMIEGDNHPEVLKLFSRMPLTAVEVLAEKLERLHQQGRIPHGDFQTASLMFVSAFFYAFMGKYRAKIAIDEEQLFLSAADVLLHGIGNP
jgi:AcrR family transcriptional regulator